MTALVAAFTNHFGPWPTLAAYQRAKNAAEGPGDHLRAFYHLPDWVQPTA